MRRAAAAAGVRLRRAPVVPATLVSAAGVIPVTVVPVLYPAIVADIPGFTIRWLGLSTTLCFAVISVAAPFVGGVVDRIGARRAVGIVALGTTVALLIVATARSAAVIVLVIAASGLMHATAATSSNLIMGAVLGGRRPATLFGVRQASVPLMSMAAGAVVAVTAGVLSWRAVVLLFGLVPAVVLAFLPSHDHQRRHAAQRAQRAPTRLPRSELAMFAAISLFAGVAVSSLATFGVVTLTRVGWSPGASAAIFAGASALGLGMRIAAGIVVDRRRWPVLGLAGGLLAGGVGGALLIATVAPGLVAVGVLVAYGAGWGFPGLLHYGIALSFRGRIASATGFVHLGSGIGVSSGPLLFSGLESWSGLRAAWTAIGLSSALAAVIAVWSSSRRTVARDLTQFIDGRHIDG